MEAVIRMGSRDDIPSLLALIRELAEYEKAPHEVELTEEELLNDGFGENPLYGFFVAELEAQVIGIALYYFKYSTWKGRCLFLEDLIVREDMRCQGIGGKLFERVVQKARDENAKRLEWQVLNWNAPALAFYRKFGASITSEWLNGRIVLGANQRT